MNDTKYWIWLTMVFGTANRRLWEAMCYFSDAKEAFEELTSGRLADRLSDSEQRNVQNISLAQAVSHIEECEKIGISIVSYGDEEYPPQLRHILNPPAVLYYRGHISCLKGTRTVTAVGTRKPTDYGKFACREICTSLAKSGVVIVSGFAVGIDITAHLAAVSVNRPTACVLGCGIDTDYPRDNIKYREEIISNGGVFVSEFPPGTPAHSMNFPKRNRILSALSRAAVVFEAAHKSGSLITAGLALEQGREVFCLPPADIFNSSFSGNIELLRDGAEPVYSYKDILECFRFGGAVDRAIRIDAGENLLNHSSFGIGELVKTRSRAKKSEKSAEASQPEKETDADTAPKTEKTAEESPKELQNEDVFSALSDIQKKIVHTISGKVLHADEIAQELDIPSAELMAELSELEILGVIKGLPGKLFKIN